MTMKPETVAITVAMPSQGGKAQEVRSYHVDPATFAMFTNPSGQIVLTGMTLQVVQISPGPVQVISSEPVPMMAL